MVKIGTGNFAEVLRELNAKARTRIQRALCFWLRIRLVGTVPNAFISTVLAEGKLLYER
jgi:hypothetical protein